MNRVEERVSQWESSARRWRLAAFGMGAAMLCVVAMGAKLKKDDNVLRVRGIEVVNDQGECLVKLGSGKWNAGSIETFDSRGKRATLLTCNDRGDGLLEILNNDAKRVFAAGASTRGDGLIRAGNKCGSWVSYIGATPNGNGVAEFKKANGSLAKEIP